MGNKGFLSFLFLGLLVATPVFLFASPVMAQDCTNPNGDEGVLLYHQDYGAFMGCTADGWKAFHPATRTPPPGGGGTCVPSGLVAHWTFDEGSGTTANDSAGSNHGTLVGSPTWTTGKIGGALDFDGNSYISLPDNTLPYEDFSFSAWVNPRYRSHGNTFYVAYKNDCASDWGGFCLYKSGEYFYADIANQAGWGWGSAPDNQWNHVLFVRDFTNSRGRFYVNGTLARDDSLSVNIETGILYTRIAASNYQGDNEKFDGLMDDVRIYNRALSGEEVAEIYNSGDGCP